jgi:hypothetical protein
MASSLVSPAIAQEEQPQGQTALWVPLQARAPEDSKEHVIIAVRGMMKSRSGAT